jgi:hypothetical protein
MDLVPSAKGNMEYTDIPGKDIHASRIALGTCAIGGSPVGPEFMAPPDGEAA